LTAYSERRGARVPFWTRARVAFDICLHPVRFIRLTLFQAAFCAYGADFESACLCARDMLKYAEQNDVKPFVMPGEKS
jgi:hypothetical protein